MKGSHRLLDHRLRLSPATMRNRATDQLLFLLHIGLSHVIHAKTSSRIAKLVIICTEPTWIELVTTTKIVTLKLVSKHLILIVFHKLVNKSQVSFFIHIRGLLGLLKETRALRLWTSAASV